jgi:hypothetical protein
MTTARPASPASSAAHAIGAGAAKGADKLGGAFLGGPVGVTHGVGWWAWWVGGGLDGRIC